MSTWDPNRLELFIRGEITLSELENVTKQDQYKIAELGYRFLREGKLDNARKVFNGLVALDPRDPYFCAVLGSIAQQKDELEEAERLYSLALDFNPFYSVAYANRGEVRLRLGKLVDAAKDLKRALEEDPEAREPSTVRARFNVKVVLSQLDSLAPPAPAVPPAPAEEATQKKPGSSQRKPKAKK